MTLLPLPEPMGADMGLGSKDVSLLPDKGQAARARKFPYFQSY